MTTGAPDEMLFQNNKTYPSPGVQTHVCVFHEKQQKDVWDNSWRNVNIMRSGFLYSEIIYQGANVWRIKKVQIFYFILSIMTTKLQREANTSITKGGDFNSENVIFAA